MEAVARVLAFLAGAALALSILASALRTVVVPRAEASLLTRMIFLAVRRLLAKMARSSVDSWSNGEIFAGGTNSAEAINSSQ